jgi:hypothetical protein
LVRESAKAGKSIRQIAKELDQTETRCGNGFGAPTSMTAKGRRGR